MTLNLRPALQSESLSTSAPYFKGTGSWDGLEIQWQAWIDLCSNKGSGRFCIILDAAPLEELLAYFLRLMCISQQYINLVSVVEMFFIDPLHRKRVDGKDRHPDQMSKDRFLLPWRPFLFVRGALCHPIRISNFSVSCFWALCTDLYSWEIVGTAQPAYN